MPDTSTIKIQGPNKKTLGTERITNIMTENKHLLATVERHRDENKRLAHELGDRDARIVKLTNTLTDLNSENDQLKTLVAQRDAEIAALKRATK